jgi:small subunit ribosomal protein S21
LKRTNDSNKNFKGPRGGGFSGDRTKTPGLYVEVRNNDINFALRKFKKKVQEAGIIQEVRERGHYVKPSEKTSQRERKVWRRQLLIGTYCNSNFSNYYMA